LADHVTPINDPPVLKEVISFIIICLHLLQSLCQ